MPKQTAVYLASLLATITVLVLSTYNLETYLQKDKVLGAEANIVQIESEQVFWENFLQENPGYFEGWIELAKIAYELGNKDCAIEALNSAKAINPNSDKIENLEKELSLFGL